MLKKNIELKDCTLIVKKPVNAALVVEATKLGGEAYDVDGGIVGELEACPYVIAHAIQSVAGALLKSGRTDEEVIAIIHIVACEGIRRALEDVVKTNPECHSGNVDKILEETAVIFNGAEPISKGNFH